MNEKFLFLDLCARTELSEKISVCTVICSCKQPKHAILKVTVVYFCWNLHQTDSFHDPFYRALNLDNLLLYYLSCLQKQN